MSVNLTKGQGVSLVKPDGSAMTKLYMGLGWDPEAPEEPKKRRFGFGGASGGRSAAIDLDASCIMLDASGKEVDTVWFRHLRSNDDAVQHSGDNLTGEGEGDDETITVRLDRLDPRVKALWFTVNSYSGQNFGRVANASCHLVDQSGRTDVDLGTFNLSGSEAQGPHTALVMAKVVKGDNGQWTATMVGEVANGRTYKDLVSVVQRLS